MAKKADPHNSDTEKDPPAATGEAKATKTKKPAAKKSATKKPAAKKASSTKKATSTKPAGANTETHSFQAETKRLLDLMIHSLYTQKEIFLRELISNASDALDRMRFEALTDDNLDLGDATLEIRLEPDPESRTLTIHDNGIGMSREEVVANIGTIARSGSRELMDRLKKQPASDEVKDLIGQFGVGFYSAFMVADRVSLVTRRAGETTATAWSSTGDGEYQIGEGERADRGTSITLHLKPEDRDGGLEDFADSWVLKRVVKRYSDFVAYPIQMREERDDTETDATGQPKEDAAKKTVVEDKTLNSQKPIWTRSQSEVKDEEYAEFYKHISSDWNEPLETLRLVAEGRIEYQALLFVPSEAPYDLYYHAYEYGLRLYVRQVMVMERCEDLLPRYLRFVRGVVDSADLPLNISRQRLQEDRHIGQIKKWLTKKILDALGKIQQDDEERYLKLWEHFGKALKEGLSSDFDNKASLLELVLFESSHDAEKLTTLDQYVSRMQEGQEEIFYLTGESRAVVESSPHLEAFKAKGIEVLYLVDTVDELLVQHLMEHDGKRLKSVGKGTVELGSEEERDAAKKVLEEKETELKDMLESFQQRLDSEIKQVRLSGRLTSSPACLVGAEHDYSPQMERLLQKGQGGGPKQRRILELNPEHALVKDLQGRFAANAEDPIVGDYAELLMGYALLAEGSEIVDPVRFNQLMVEALGRGLTTGG